ncbi:MAG TPA: sirohydrochlorin chelatase [Chloroflexota bacterium]|nr:sirohydrochlorin chelatase [Chloroflexota bacterium]
MTDRALLLIAHGSRDADARDEYARIREALAQRLSDEVVVFSVLEFPDQDHLPSIQEGWRRCVAAGARRVVVLPFFLFPAGHVRDDLPGELEQARAKHLDATLELLPPLGPAEELLDVLEERAGQAIAQLAGDPDGLTAVVLVGAGTSDPDANGDLCKVARLLWERSPYPLVEVAWISLTTPNVRQAVDRCVALGARRIALVPYFLNTGVLLRRIGPRLGPIRQQHPRLAIQVAPQIGPHPRLIDLLARRSREGLDGECRGHGWLAVCGRPSCTAIASARSRLLRAPT